MLTRRATLLLPLLAMPALARAETLRPSGRDDTLFLQKKIDDATQGSGFVQLGAGEFQVSHLKISGSVQLSGLPGRTILRADVESSLLSIAGAERISVQGISFASNGASTTLLLAEDVNILSISECNFSGGGTGLAATRCGGWISGNAFAEQQATAVHALDSLALKISGNTLKDIGNNGIRVWRSEKGEDGTIVSDNHISGIEAKDGGDGQNGNGINVYKAGNVIVANNRISDCAFSAIRNNAGDACSISGNIISRCREVALYVEFGFLGANVSNNILEDVAHGISITNFNEGGRLAICSGNLIRNARGKNAHGEPLGGGIFAEADTVVSGNIVEDAENSGIAFGWGKYGRNLSANGNTLRNCGRGISFSALAPGPFVLSNNLIAGSGGGAIIGMDHDTMVTGDLSLAGSQLPASLHLDGNVVSAG